MGDGKAIREELSAVRGKARELEERLQKAERLNRMFMADKPGQHAVLQGVSRAVSPRSLLKVVKGRENDEEARMARICDAIVKRLAEVGSRKSVEQKAAFLKSVFVAGVCEMMKLDVLKGVQDDILKVFEMSKCGTKSTKLK